MLAALMPALATVIVSFITLVLLRLINNQQVINFSFSLFAITLAIIYGGIILVSSNWNDTIIICLPIIVLASLEKLSSIYLTRFVNNDRVSIIKLFIILGYFTGLILAKYLLK